MTVRRPLGDFGRFAARVNYGFDKVARLEGNVGYLKMQGFMPAALGGEVAAAAMTFLASTDALIIDLRENGGGDPEMVALITSYLFGEEPVHLNDIYQRPTDSTTQFWTRSYVPGRRFGATKPIYVLTSAYTFSAAEEFTYNLKSLGRATIGGRARRAGIGRAGVRPRLRQGAKATGSRGEGSGPEGAADADPGRSAPRRPGRRQQVAPRLVTAAIIRRRERTSRSGWDGRSW